MRRKRQMQIKNKKKKYSPITIATLSGALLGLIIGLAFSVIYLSRIYLVKYIFIYMGSTLFMWSFYWCLAGTLIGLASGGIIVSRKK